MRALILSLGLLALSGCASVSRVMALSTSPDGRMVTVTGARLKKIGTSWYVSDPLMWTCMRAGNGQLGCRVNVPSLPQP